MDIKDLRKQIDKEISQVYTQDLSKYKTLGATQYNQKLLEEMLRMGSGLSQEDQTRLQTLRELEAARVGRRNTEIVSDPNIRQIASEIEANNTAILKLLNANEILKKSKDHFADEICEEFDKNNPPEHKKEIDELQERENKSSMSGLMGFDTNRRGAAIKGTFGGI